MLFVKLSFLVLAPRRVFAPESTTLRLELIVASIIKYVCVWMVSGLEERQKMKEKS